MIIIIYRSDCSFFFFLFFNSYLTEQMTYLYFILQQCLLKITIPYHLLSYPNAGLPHVQIINQFSTFLCKRVLLPPPLTPWIFNSPRILFVCFCVLCFYFLFLILLYFCIKPFLCLCYTRSNYVTQLFHVHTH